MAATLASHLKPDAITLALELSSRSGSVAVGQGSTLLAVEQVDKSSRHADEVMPTIARMFDSCGLQPTQLDSIFVSIGPGGFTGIRLGVTIAKMLALSVGAGIVPIRTSEVVAESVPVPLLDQSADLQIKPSVLHVVLASKRGQSWCVSFEADPTAGVWNRRSEGTIAELETFVTQHLNTYSHQPTHSTIIAADVVDDALTQVGATHGWTIVQADHRAEACWNRGIRILVDTPVADSPLSSRYIQPAQLLPFYAREPEAVRIWESRRDRSEPNDGPNTPKKV